MKRPEENLQRAIVAHLNARLIKPWMFWSTPNGGGRSKAEAGILKATGTKPGIPDLFVLGPDRHLIAIELKAPPVRLDGGKLSQAKPRISDDQRARINELGVCGVPTLIIRDLDECLNKLAAMGVPLKGMAR